LYLLEQKSDYVMYTGARFEPTTLWTRASAIYTITILMVCDFFCVRLFYLQGRACRYLPCNTWSPPRVNFINILRKNFSFKSALHSFSLVTFWVCNSFFGKKIFAQKSHVNCWWNWHLSGHDAKQRKEGDWK